MTEFRVLGQVQAWVAGRAVDLGPPKQRAVLATLLVDAGRPVSVDLVVDRVWGEDPPAQARGALYSHIMRIRRALDPAAELDRGPAGYVLAVDPDRVDLHRFRRLVAQADGAADEARLKLLREAVALWQGEPLAGVTGEWAERMRGSWQQEYVDAVIAWAEAELRAGNPVPVCGPLRDLAHEYPLVEPLGAVLMRALGAAGRTAEALECYTAYRRRFADELGVDPGAELQAVQRELLRGGYDPPAVASVPTPPPAAGEARPVPGRARIVTTGGMLILSYLTIGLVAMYSGAYAVHAYGPTTFAAVLAGLLACVAVLTVLAVLYERWPRARWYAAVTVASLTVFSLAVLPAPATVVDTPGGAVWSAYTTEPAPLFDPAGNLIQTLPTHYRVEVTCRYTGDPPRRWRTSGTEDHVITPDVGHIPDPYLRFGTAKPILPRCGYRR
jgi:DNA-binding SARP family transcriptional activator